MWSPVLVKLESGLEFIVNEHQVCCVSSVPESDSACLYMSNKDVLICTSPSYEEWKNDVYIRNS